MAFVMILYQLAQWMDERSRLQTAMRQTAPEEELHLLQNRIRQLEEQLYGQARQWMAAYQPPAALDLPYKPYEPPVLNQDFTL
jgi:hypothetical protein